MNLIQHIIDAVDRYWAQEVQILGAWPDGPAAACVVYRRTIDPMLILGRRFEFTADAADGTIEGYARDVAIDLDEPIGSLATSSRRDQYGVMWIVIPEDVPTPEPPDDVLRVLTGR